MKPLIWSGPATEDLFQIADYYDGVEAGVGERMLDRIVAETTMLMKEPHLGEIIKETAVRGWRVKRTPFTLLYVASAARLEILCVHHAAQRWHGIGE